MLKKKKKDLHHPGIDLRKDRRAQRTGGSCPTTREAGQRSTDISEPRPRQALAPGEVPGLPHRVPTALKIRKGVFL